ncbi:MAG: ABC transporter permease subunit, partial [Bacillota bacterium]
NILIRKVFSVIISGFFAVFMLTLLANIDPGSNIKVINNDISTNISGYLTIKRSVLYLRTLLNPGDYNKFTDGNILETIYNSSKLSIMLISSSLAFSTIVGIIRGMYEGHRSRKAKLGSIGTLVFFSIPDVLIVLLTLLGYTLVAMKFPAIRDATYIKGFVLPLLTLSIIPTIYISRITFITIQEELGKDYIRNAIAKGFSRKKTIFYELIPAISFKIVDTLPAIMTMLLTNMIIVEWLFNYRGILYFLLYFYNRQDVYRFVPLALTLGLMYIVFTWGVQLLARLINPLKSKGAK